MGSNNFSQPAVIAQWPNFSPLNVLYETRRYFVPSADAINCSVTSRCLHCLMQTIASRILHLKPQISKPATTARDRGCPELTVASRSMEGKPRHRPNARTDYTHDAILKRAIGGSAKETRTQRSQKRNKNEKKSCTEGTTEHSCCRPLRHENGNLWPRCPLIVVLPRQPLC